MKTQQQLQKIFDILVAELKHATAYNRFYVMINLQSTPLEKFLTSVQEKLTPEDFDREFLSRVYAQAFHTGDIPKNRNHIAITCQIQSALFVKIWIDLDKVATQLNAHFSIHVPYSFKVKYKATSERTYGGYQTCRSSGTVLFIETTAVNSFNDPWDNYFLFNCILSSFRDRPFVLLSLTLASLLTTGNISTAGASLFAGVTCFGIFKGIVGLNTKIVPIGSNHEKIEDVFQKHFTERIEVPNIISDRVEMIDDGHYLNAVKFKR